MAIVIQLRILNRAIATLKDLVDYLTDEIRIYLHLGGQHTEIQIYIDLLKSEHEQLVRVTELRDQLQQLEDTIYHINQASYYRDNPPPTKRRRMQ
jgi:hypothetical protein